MGWNDDARGWDSGIFKDPFQLQLFIKTEIQELSCISAAFYIFEGLFHPGMSAGSPSVEILFQSAVTSPGMLRNGIRDCGDEGKEGEHQSRAQHPPDCGGWRNQNFVFTAVVGPDPGTVQGIPAFSHIRGRVVWERFQRPPLQGCLMTLKFVPLCRQSRSLEMNSPFHFSSCPWNALHRYTCGWVLLLIAAPTAFWVHGAGSLQTCNRNPTIKLMVQVLFLLFCCQLFPGSATAQRMLQPLSPCNIFKGLVSFPAPGSAPKRLLRKLLSW